RLALLMISIMQAIPELVNIFIARAIKGQAPIALILISDSPALRPEQLAGAWNFSPGAIWSGVLKTATDLLSPLKARSTSLACAMKSFQGNAFCWRMKTCGT